MNRLEADEESINDSETLQTIIEKLQTMLVLSLNRLDFVMMYRDWPIAFEKVC